MRVRGWPVTAKGAPQRSSHGLKAVPYRGAEVR
jgi:hypothetical protein